MNVILRFVSIGILLLVAGCVSAPRQTVELAEIIDQQIAEMQVSHEKFVRLYYDKLRDEVEHFMEQKWIPQFLSNVVEGRGESSKQYRSDLDKAYKLASLDWENTIEISKIEDEDVKKAVLEVIKKLATQEKATLGIVQLDFSKAIQKQINKQRKELIQPIDEQEEYVLDQLRVGYADLQRSSAVIKGYLASTVEVVEQREVILEKADTLETYRNILDIAMRMNDVAVAALNVAENADIGVESFLEEFSNAKVELNKIINKGDN